MITGNEQVYPTLKTSMQEEEGVTSYQPAYGLTIRHHFAALAMQGLIGGCMLNPAHVDVANCAKNAVAAADALIAALNN